MFHKAHEQKISYCGILTPMREQMGKLRASRNQRNSQAFEINKKMANLTEQNRVRSGLKSKGCIDSALFMSQTNELNRKTTNLRADKCKLMWSYDNDSGIVDTQNLIEISDSAPDYLREFDQQIFESIVERIIVISNEQIKFRLINGLELTEKI